MSDTTSPPDDVQKAEAHLRRMIAEGRLPSDGRLPPERELAAELELSRRAVRRALEGLEADGLVWRRQGKGTFAGQPPDPAGAMAAGLADAADPLSVMEARLLIEPGLAALAAGRVTAADAERLRHLAERATAATSADQAELWDGALHRLIARIAGNPILLTTFTFLDEVRLCADWRETRNRARTAETMALYDAQHRAIVEAIASGRAEAAAEAMRAHLAALSANLARTLAAPSRAPSPARELEDAR